MTIGRCLFRSVRQTFGNRSAPSGLPLPVLSFPRERREMDGRDIGCGPRGTRAPTNRRVRVGVASHEVVFLAFHRFLDRRDFLSLSALLLHMSIRKEYEIRVRWAVSGLDLGFAKQGSWRRISGVKPTFQRARETRVSEHRFRISRTTQ